MASLKVVIVFLAVCCAVSAFNFEKKKDDCEGQLREMGREELDYVKDVSALTFDCENDRLLVSDRLSGKVFEISKKGKLKRTIDTKAKDIQGMYMLHFKKHEEHEDVLCLLKGKCRSIIAVDKKGRRLGKPIVLPLKDSKAEVKGLAVDMRNNRFFVVQNSKPLVFYSLRIEHEEKQMKAKVLAKKEIEELTDISDLEFDEKDSTVWAVSSKDKKVIKFSEEGEMIGHWEIDVEGVQGIGLDEERVFLVAKCEKGDRKRNFLLFHEKPHCRRKDPEDELRDACDEEEDMLF